MAADYTAIIIAGIAAVPPTIMAGIAWFSAHGAKKQTSTSDGPHMGELVEQNTNDIRSLKSDVAYHVVVQHGRGLPAFPSPPD